MHTRTNIVIDNRLMSEAMAATGFKTKREAVDKALRLMLRLKRQEKARDLIGTVNWIGDLDEMRRD